MSSKTVTEAQENVARGVSLLDEVCPDWFVRIDVDTLDIGDPFHCVLGQVYGSYDDGEDRVFPHISRYMMPITCFEHGFLCLSTRDEPEIANLWKQVIQERIVTS